MRSEFEYVLNYLFPDCDVKVNAVKIPSLKSTKLVILDDSDLTFVTYKSTVYICLEDILAYFGFTDRRIREISKQFGEVLYLSCAKPGNLKNWKRKGFVDFPAFAKIIVRLCYNEDIFKMYVHLAQVESGITPTIIPRVYAPLSKKIPKNMKTVEQLV